jgi:hypothetical protein
MQELSQILGYDISFSEEEIVKNAEQAFAKAVSESISKEVNEWMKSAFS